jgi:hypothetical protein
LIHLWVLQGIGTDEANANVLGQYSSQGLCSQKCGLASLDTYWIQVNYHKGNNNVVVIIVIIIITIVIVTIELGPLQQYPTIATSDITDSSEWNPSSMQMLGRT